jgi:hypothetical protein
MQLRYWICALIETRDESRQYAEVMVWDALNRKWIGTDVTVAKDEQGYFPGLRACDHIQFVPNGRPYGYTLKRHALNRAMLLKEKTMFMHSVWVRAADQYTLTLVSLKEATQ